MAPKKVKRTQEDPKKQEVPTGENNGETVRETVKVVPRETILAAHEIQIGQRNCAPAWTNLAWGDLHGQR